MTSWLTVLRDGLDTTIMSHIFKERRKYIASLEARESIQKDLSIESSFLEGRRLKNKKMVSDMKISKKHTALRLLFMFLSVTFACRQSQNDTAISEKGFIIVDDQEYWYFVPAEVVDSLDCFKNLNSGQLKKGVQFDPTIISNLSYVKRTFDTLVDDKKSRYLKVTPVKMVFTLKPNHFKLYKSDDTDGNWNFKFKAVIRKEPVEFTFNVFPLGIDTVRPLFCLNTKVTDVQECRCSRKETDPDDYLFKICNYVKAQDRYSNLPCKYTIKSISHDTLQGTAVRKVELTCCYLGDVAYFDEETDEIIKIYYGAQ